MRLILLKVADSGHPAHPAPRSISSLNGSTVLENHHPPPGSSPPLSRGEALLSVLALSLGLWRLVGTVVSLLL
jgi:hypothetical protein